MAKITTVADFDYGQCFTVNTNAYEVIEQAGNTDRSKLQLKLFAQYHDFWPQFGKSDAPGFLVMVHARGTAPDTASGFRVSPGHHASVGITKRSIVRLPAPFEDDCESESVPAHIRTRLPGECAGIRLLEFVAKDCGCYDHYLERFTIDPATGGYPGAILALKKLPVCGTLDAGGTVRIGDQCRREAHATFFQSFNYEEQCSSPCAETSFKTSVMVQPWPTVSSVAMHEKGLAEKNKQSLRLWARGKISAQEVDDAKTKCCDKIITDAEDNDEFLPTKNITGIHLTCLDSCKNPTNPLEPPQYCAKLQGLVRTPGSTEEYVYDDLRKTTKALKG